MLEELKQIVYEANMELPRRGLITYAWGNVSDIDREKGLSVIKPSGMDHDKLKPFQIAVVDLEGNKAEGDMNPSSDTTTHVELYRALKDISGIVYTHSPHVAAWAQIERALPCYGTTHADYSCGEVPYARNLTEEEIGEGCEMSTGRVIVETFAGKNPVCIPAVLCENHGLLTRGKDAAEAARNVVALEEVAKMNHMTEMLNLQMEPAPQYILDKHFMYKHGPNAYYGQRNR